MKAPQAASAWMVTVVVPLGGGNAQTVASKIPDGVSVSFLEEQVRMFDPEVISALIGSSFIEAIEEEDRDADAIKKHLEEERAADSHFLKWFDDSHYDEHTQGPLKPYYPEVKIRRAFDRLKGFLDMAGQDIFGNLRQQNAILGEQFASLLERTVGDSMIEDLKALMEVFNAELELLDKTAKNYKTEALAQSDRGQKLKEESAKIVEDVSDKWDKISDATMEGEAREILRENSDRVKTHLTNIKASPLMTGIDVDPNKEFFTKLAGELIGQMRAYVPTSDKLVEDPEHLADIQWSLGTHDFASRANDIHAFMDLLAKLHVLLKETATKTRLETYVGEGIYTMPWAKGKTDDQQDESRISALLAKFPSVLGTGDQEEYYAAKKEKLKPLQTFPRKYGAQGKVVGGGGSKGDESGREEGHREQEGAYQGDEGGERGEGEEEEEEASFLEVKKGLDLEKLAKEVSTELITSEAAVAEAEAELSNKGGTKISGVEDGHHGADGHRRSFEQHHSDEERGDDEVDDDRADDAIGEIGDGHADDVVNEEHADEDEISGEHADDGSLGGPRSYAGHLEQMDYGGHDEDNRSEHRDEGDHQGDQNDEEDHESDQGDEEADRSSGMDDDYRGDGTELGHQSEEQEDGEETIGEGGNDKYEYLDGVKKLFKKEGKEADSSSFVHKKMEVHAHTARTTAAPGSLIQTGPDGDEEEEEDDDEGQQEKGGEDDGEEGENGDEEGRDDKDAREEEPSRGGAGTHYDVEGLDQGVGEGNADEGKKDLSDVRLTIEGSVPMTPDTIKKSNEQPKENLKEQQDVLLVKYQVLVSRIDGAVNALKATGIVKDALLAFADRIEESSSKIMETMWVTNKKEVRKIIGDKEVLKLDQINPSESRKHVANAYDKLKKMYAVIEQARAAWALVGPKYSDWGSEDRGAEESALGQPDAARAVGVPGIADYRTSKPYSSSDSSSKTAGNAWYVMRSRYFGENVCRCLLDAEHDALIHNIRKAMEVSEDVCHPATIWSEGQAIPEIIIDQEDPNDHELQGEVTPEPEETDI
ncbi:hypothetical protein FOZ61_008900 [Perkinsus olseni]|uniref:Uncharacterized protein n=1 Tax=Perkinsus olseni TaxID=32597 RepID=A0A7J6M7L0_PEROL|nr:hypothetical protein FOZ61_008900 [Perkinsus olseni]